MAENNKAFAFSAEGINFVAGLFWQPLSESTNGSKQKEIKFHAKDLNFELFVLRNTHVPCVGFANTYGDIKAGLSSVAALVSKTVEMENGSDNFIFVTEVPSGEWIYVAQRDGLILPDGDEVFASESAAKSRLLEDVSSGDWAYIFAPSIWGINKTTERTLESMLPKDKKGKVQPHKWWKLANVNSGQGAIRQKGLIVLLALAVGASLFGYKKYQEIKLKKEMEAAALAAQAQIDAQGHIVPPEHPWKTKPAAAGMMNACMQAIYSVNLFPGNWELVTANCSGDALTVTWKPKGEQGWIQHLREVYPNATISLDGSVASINVPLGEMQTGYDEAVLDSNERLVQMYTAAQRYGFKFLATPAAPAAPVLPGQEGVNAAPIKDWNEITWKADNIVLPQSVLAGLDGDGFRMNSMSAAWQSGKFTWTMEGIQYVKP